MVTFDGRQNFLDKNAIKSDENGRQNTEEETKPIELGFTLGSNNETEEHNDDSADAELGDRLAQNDALEQGRPEHCERSRNLIEGYLNELKAKVVENDHGEVHNGQGSDGFGHLHVELHFRKH